MRTRFWLWGAVLLPAVAGATPTFPTVVQRELSLTQQPQCSLCHENGITGRGTVNTPMGRALRQRGLVANDEASLVSALGQLGDGKVDSDADGTPDTEELKAGADPNVGLPSQPVDPIGPPRYGCGAEAAGGAGGALLLGALLLAPLARRRRASSVSATAA